MAYVGVGYTGLKYINILFLICCLNISPALPRIRSPRHHPVTQGMAYCQTWIEYHWQPSGCICTACLYRRLGISLYHLLPYLVVEVASLFFLLTISYRQYGVSAASLKTFKSKYVLAFHFYHNIFRAICSI